MADGNYPSERIVVFDDRSTDRTVDEMVEFYQTLKYLKVMVHFLVEINVQNS